MVALDLHRLSCFYESSQLEEYFGVFATLVAREEFFIFLKEGKVEIVFPQSPLMSLHP
jgi:hypothetical protein